MSSFPYYWRVRKWLPDRFAMRCRILLRARGPGPRNVLVEFADGYRVVTCGWFVRKVAT